MHWVWGCFEMPTLLYHQVLPVLEWLPETTGSVSAAYFILIVFCGFKSSQTPIPASKIECYGGEEVEESGMVTLVRKKVVYLMIYTATSRDHMTWFVATSEEFSDGSRVYIWDLDYSVKAGSWSWSDIGQRTVKDRGVEETRDGFTIIRVRPTRSGVGFPTIQGALHYGSRKVC